ncbi:MAG: hypothetical protein HYR73_06950 [Candidatus Eisenbacteria bacterium]|nr:hypothetical protein [Candidatus Eisenbacteria bacterium]
MSVAWSAYRLFAPTIGALAPHARWLASPDERPLWGERMGRVEAAHACDAWIHAASMGEASAAPPLIRELLAHDPAAALRLTSTTRSGRSRLGGLGPPVSLAPIDSPQAIARFVGHVKPARLFVIETEIWPHWLLAARGARIPVAFVSARLSARSVLGYARLGAGLRELLATVRLVLCQSDEDAGRWISIGARPDRTHVTGNLKFDALREPAPDRRSARIALGLDPDRPLLTLGSVRPGEATFLANAWRALDASETMPRVMPRSWARAWCRSAVTIRSSPRPAERRC